MRSGLRLRLLGAFTVESEPPVDVPVGKARRALAVLALRRGEFVPVDRLVDALWGQRPPERPDRNVAALVSRLRRALGRELIEGSAAGYRLPADAVAVDLHEAGELVTTAESDLGHGRFALAATSGELATKLLDGDLAMAGEHEDRWIEELRDTVAALLHRARLAWSAAALELGSHDTAAQVAADALHADPFDESACRTLMLAHHRAGRPGAALVAYRSLAATLAEHLGIDPSPATRELHLTVLRSDAGPGAPVADPAVHTAPPATGIVGRDAELARLRRSWSGAAAGVPALAVVTGDAGVGKSALVEALVVETRRAGALVVQVACFEAERSLYLQPLVDLVRAVVDRTGAEDVRWYAGRRLATLAGLVPELADVLGPVPDERVGPEVGHRRSLDAVSGFLTRVGERRPVLLVVEDMQHAGQSTVEALHFLAAHAQGSRLMVLLTERVVDGVLVTGQLRDLATTLPLGPLTRADVAELVRRSGVGHDPARIWAWTGGSPLFLTELLRLPVASEPPAIPATLADAVAARLDRAGDAVTHLLSQGAVLGAAFSVEDVAALSGLGPEDCAVRADRAVRAGLLTAQGDTFRFANDIVRRVAYERASEPVRVNRHRRAARVLAARPEAAAQQLMAAGDPRGAATRWLAAAGAAHVAFSHVDAERLLDEALAAAASGGDVAQRVLVHLLRGQVRRDLGRYADARADHETARELARDLDDPELEARALEQLGWTAFYARDALAVDLAEQATQLAESAAAAPRAVPSATLLLGRVRHWDGDYAGAEAAYERVLSAPTDDATTAMAIAYRGALLQHQDRFVEAQAVLARATVLCRRSGEFRPLLQALFFTGLARGDLGDFAGALRALDHARRLIDAENLDFYRAGIETTTSWILQELGCVGEAREHAVLAVELARRGGGALELEQELHALLAVADCDLMTGRTDDAAAAVEQAGPMLERSLPFRPRATMRLVEMRARWDAAEAEGLLDVARRYSSPKYEALALRHLGRPEEAARTAAGTGSDLLIAQLGIPADAEAARARIAGALPLTQRETFVRAGRLTAPPPPTR